MNFNFFAKILQHSTEPLEQRKVLYSKHLERDVLIEILLPKGYRKTKKYPLVIFNDGQDFPALEMKENIESMYKYKLIPKAIVVGLHCNDNRMNEYGVAGIPDYANRGNKAKQHSDFVVTEALPFLLKNYGISDKKEDITIAGFSLGGLSAFDIAWNHSDIFGKVGVFSGALWWRSQPFSANNPDGHRILHDMVTRDKKREGLTFWFQTGTHDEDADRNNNGVIDSIDDTLDLIRCLRGKGYTAKDFTYVEIEEGKHDTNTWADAMLDFMMWAL